MKLNNINTRIIYRVQENCRKEVWGEYFKETPTFIFLLNENKVSISKIRKDKIMLINKF